MLQQWFDLASRPFRRKPSSENALASHFIPVLCYHSWTIGGQTYETNDHVALEHDLHILAQRGYQVLPATTLVALLRGELPWHKIRGHKLVCLTCDDGRDFDYHSHDDDHWGRVESFRDILHRSKDWLPQFAPGPRAISFVIASPEARAILDHTCGNGRKEWQDDWWHASAQEGVLGIANHSWDHVHDTLEQVRQHDNIKGSFHEITTFADAEAQIAAAQHYIAQVTDNNAIPVFGYPYGHVPPYLSDEYFPQHGERLGIQAAFGTDAASARPTTNRWNIPRFVCGGHWKTPADFTALLDAVERGER